MSRQIAFLLLFMPLISIVQGVVIETYPTTGVVAGQFYAITYSPKNKPATFILRKGLSTDLQTIATLGTGTDGSFIWTVSSDLPSAKEYAIQVAQGSEINYSGQFRLSDGPESFALSSSSTPSSSRVAPSAASSVAWSTATRAESSIVSSAVFAASSAGKVPSASTSGPSSISSTAPGSATSSTLESTSSNTSMTTPPAAQNNSGALSTGAKAGIGVGASIAGLILALGAFLLGISARKKKIVFVETEDGSGGGGKPELDGVTAYQELDADHTHGNPTYPELAAAKGDEVSE